MFYSISLSQTLKTTIIIIVLFTISCNGDSFISPEKEQQYGVCWSCSDPYDPGRRCFGSKGEKVFIGVGNRDGYSDFDSIYPWSEIKRCNIQVNGDQQVIVFEGEDGFSLDGTSGDVFVRIPVFNYKRYVQDGFEYRVISKEGDSVHPAFIEAGRVLDAVYISAFEGWYDESGNMLYSKGGVIPSSSLTGDTFLSAARARGANYTLYDNRAVDLVYTLMAVEFGGRNMNHYLGYGYADYWQPDDIASNRVVVEEKNTNEIKINLLPQSLLDQIPVGSNITICRGSQSDVIGQRTILSVEKDSKNAFTIVRFDGAPISVDKHCFIGSAACTTNYCELCDRDSRLNWHTGRADFIKGSLTRNPIRYRWMENLWGSLWHFLPDVSFEDSNMYICEEMASYSIGSVSPPYHQVVTSLPVNTDNGIKDDSAGTNYWVDAIIQDGLSGISFGCSYNQNLTSKDAYGAYYYLNPDSACIVNGGGFDHLWRCNILTNRAWVTKSTKWYLYGARLMYKPIVP